MSWIGGIRSRVAHTQTEHKPSYIYILNWVPIYVLLLAQWILVFGPSRMIGVGE